MHRVRRFAVGLMAVMVWSGGDLARAQSVTAPHAEVISRLQQMAQGTFTQEEWSRVIGDLDRLLAGARERGADNEVVELTVLRAKVHELRGEQDAALGLLEQMVTTYRDADVPAMKKVYVALTDVHAQRGDVEAVNRVIERYRASRHVDSETYAYSGGFGPSDPLVITRPSALGEASVALTAMKVNRTRARFAPGQPFPAFAATGYDGRAVSLDGVRGQVVLIDFWAPGAFVWRRELTTLRGLRDRYRGQGFEVVGLALDPSAEAVTAFARAEGMTWPLAAAPRTLTRELGVFGDATNFLLDGNGTILGRDLHGAALDEAVRSALGVR
jgi:peroxiredoxin